MPDPAATPPADRRRWRLLHEFEAWLETPMMVLSVAWLALVVFELVWGEWAYFTIFGTAIWVVFIAEFLLRLALAPAKAAFLGNNLITIVALAVPAFRLLRVLRVLRLARAARSLTLVRAIGATNRGMRALRRTLKRRGLGYVLTLTLLVTLFGSAGMYALEPRTSVEGGFVSYFDALWWTAMILTSMGSAYWPQTGEGRILTLLLSIYGFSVFGYITATFASFFVEEDAKRHRRAERQAKLSDIAE